MNRRTVDLAIVGGGLAGGLIALAIQRACPQMSLALFDAGEQLGGNHRWSWFSSDLDAAGSTLMGDFATRDWQTGNAVRFPAHDRELAANYRSLASCDFDAALRRILPTSAICTAQRVSSLDADGLEMANGERVSAQRVIDCRTFEPTRHLTGGWQVFLGRHLRTKTPHGVERPIIMDADVAQHGAYRFVYTLPLAADELFVEDTYYADHPDLDATVLSQRIDAYSHANGWVGEEIGRETGVLPVITGGDFSAYRQQIAIPGVAIAGARGGFSHPLTSYTVPIAVRTALLIARNADLSGPELASLVEREATKHWQATRFYRFLGQMLFGAGAPEDRFRIFERFYRLPEPLIERFYAARSTTGDKLRILAGKPPVPIAGAIRALLGNQPPLVHEENQ
ncbi:lycopene beta-cyclase CrtY [Qipengyuania marisflavi]|uniref:Lycopene beta-cyclase CrtY n=1 Tax=Qipengyuania marisflavi TaxID=2486356 RepID=A0A5S3P2W4_9SPHN|nr:lycopene beta-cyclase CrtY [Qipengyuania marisflavi]TMM47322.1 lycopene beta-cyclase CrtY [Qipengyuania marisflavi]